MFEVIAEQTGARESEFKAALCDLFRMVGSVERAYLALIKHDLAPSPAPDGAVALCLLPRRGAQIERTIALCISMVRQTFNQHTSIDIIPLNGMQDFTLYKCCKPFFENQSP